MWMLQELVTVVMFVESLLVVAMSTYTLPVGSVPAGSMALACGPCNVQKCTDWQSLGCKHGYTLDSCQCCFKCALPPDAVCGGSQNIYGTCGFDTYCRYFSSELGNEKQQRMGICTSVIGLPKAHTYVPKGVYKYPPGVQQTVVGGNTAAGEPSMMKDDPEVDLINGGTKPGKSSSTKSIVDRYVTTESPCAPACTPKLCEADKRAICSATNVIQSAKGSNDGCDNTCHHTSCLACDFILDISACGQCDPTDKKCLKAFGLCMKENKRSLKTMNSMMENFNDGIKYACAVPDCPNY